MQIEEDVTDNVSHLVHETLLQFLSKKEISEKKIKYLSPLIGTKTKKQLNYTCSTKSTPIPQQKLDL